VVTNCSYSGRVHHEGIRAVSRADLYEEPDETRSVTERFRLLPSESRHLRLWAEAEDTSVTNIIRRALANEWSNELRQARGEEIVVRRTTNSWYPRATGPMGS